MPTPTHSQNVSFVRAEVTDAAKDWQIVYDCVAGERRIKSRGDEYLPRPNPDNTTAENLARYESFLGRAVFYNITGRTLKGLVGQVFSRESEIEVPETLEIVKENACGDGVSLEQQAKRALRQVLMAGRSGVLADFPITETAVSRAQQESGEIRPVLKLYPPSDIINWKTKQVGAKILLSMLVLREYEDVEVDEFEIDTQLRYRVLRLDKESGNYTVQIYKDIDGKNDSGQEPLGELIEPKDSAGKPFKEIPFSFIGAENNDHMIDDSPLLDIATLNIAHYRNSADNEQSTFITGQPTLWASGITKDWNEDVLKGNMNFGALGGIALPRDAQAGILQADPNTMAQMGMEHKEAQMVKLGAKLVETTTVEKTATQSRQDEAAELSVLGSAAKNVSLAYRVALTFAAQFVGTEITEENMTFGLNSDFDLSTMSTEERAQVVKEWQAEAISFTEMRHNLKRGGVAHLEDEEFKQDLIANPPITIPEENGSPDPNNGGDD